MDGGGRPRALIRGQGRVGLAGKGWGWVLQRGASQGRGQGRVGLAVSKGFGCGGVGGRGTGPRDGANRNVSRIFVVSNAYKKKKNGFF